jgi:fumarate reductase (CoM/CoB) subunit A
VLEKLIILSVTNMKRIDTDSSVIGAGGAGASDAVEAASSSLRVRLATKGTFGLESCTGSTPGAYAAAFDHADPMDSPDEHFPDIVLAGAYVVDQHLVRVIADEAPERFMELEK